MGKKNKKQPAMRLLEDWSEKVQENEAVFHEKVKATVKRQLTRKQQRKSAAAAWGAASSGAASPERGAASPPAAGTGRGLRLQLDAGSDGEVSRHCLCGACPWECAAAAALLAAPSMFHHHCSAMLC
jgi:hypothetical protein